MSDSEVEKIVLVKQDGTPTGEILPKLQGHHANTPLHLAFSCYIFNEEGQFLVTQRAKSKKVWPGVWTNSVCGHPAPGETMIDAIKRRLKYELGMTASRFQLMLPTYSYKTPPYKGIIEHEYCPVYIARATGKPNPNPEEVEDLRWVEWQEYVKELERDIADTYSWWCKDQLKQLRNNTLIGEYSKQK